MSFCQTVNDFLCFHESMIMESVHYGHIVTLAMLRLGHRCGQNTTTVRPNGRTSVGPMPLLQRDACRSLNEFSCCGLDKTTSQKTTHSSCTNYTIRIWDSLKDHFYWSIGCIIANPLANSMPAPHRADFKQNTQNVQPALMGNTQIVTQSSYRQTKFLAVAS